ncbi:MAG TPA: hypothetical protein VGT08_18755 [Terracidiphilus sp.]|nr:hypothetical protein [Terracidiphilus sp.]
MLRCPLVAVPQTGDTLDTRTTGQMFEKSGKYYADWRDQSGRRLRKSFTTARAALTHEAQQREDAHPKKRALGRPSPKFSTPRSRAAKQITTVRAASSLKPEAATRKASVLRMPSKSTRG